MLMDATSSTNASRKSVQWAVDEKEPQVIERPQKESSQTMSMDATSSATGLAQGSVGADPAAEGKTQVASRRMSYGTQSKSSRGSVHGLTAQSKKSFQWVHKIPNLALGSSVFNLLDVGFRMLSILSLAASVAEMLTGGMELVLSIVAARVVRERRKLPGKLPGRDGLVLGHYDARTCPCRMLGSRFG
jgi:hypothetical protein